jgi:predicted transcriptional regulator
MRNLSDEELAEERLELMRQDIAYTNTVARTTPIGDLVVRISFSDELTAVLRRITASLKILSRAVGILPPYRRHPRSAKRAWIYARKRGKR